MPSPLNMTAFAVIPADLEGAVNDADYGVMVPLFNSEIDAMEWLDRKRQDPKYELFASSWKVVAVRLRQLRALES